MTIIVIFQLLIFPRHIVGGNTLDITVCVPMRSYLKYQRFIIQHIPAESKSCVRYKFVKCVIYLPLLGTFEGPWNIISYLNTFGKTCMHALMCKNMGMTINSINLLFENSRGTNLHSYNIRNLSTS